MAPFIRSAISLYAFFAFMFGVAVFTGEMIKSALEDAPLDPARIKIITSEDSLTLHDCKRRLNSMLDK